MEELRLPNSGVKVDFSHCSVKIDKMFDIHDNGTVIVRYDCEKVESASKPAESDSNIEEVTRTKVLSTELAEQMWQKLHTAGFVDRDKQPTVSIRKASIMAHEMSEKLGIPTPWVEYEELWQMKDLCNAFNKATFANYFSNFSKTIVKALR